MSAISSPAAPDSRVELLDVLGQLVALATSVIVMRPRVPNKSILFGAGAAARRHWVFKQDRTIS